MPAQAIQAHSKAIWSDSALGGGVLDVTRAYVIRDGADVTFSTVGPEELAFYDVDGLGFYELIDLSPVYLVFDGSDLTLSLIGPAAAVLADGGSGDIEITTDLSRPAVAEWKYDLEGNIRMIRSPANRLNAVLVGGHIQLYA